MKIAPYLDISNTTAVKLGARVLLENGCKPRFSIHFLLAWMGVKWFFCVVFGWTREIMAYNFSVLLGHPFFKRDQAFLAAFYV